MQIHRDNNKIFCYNNTRVSAVAISVLLWDKELEWWRQSSSLLLHSSIVGFIFKLNIPIHFNSIILLSTWVSVV